MPAASMTPLKTEDHFFDSLTSAYTCAGLLFKVFVP